MWLHFLLALTVFLQMHNNNVLENYNQIVLHQKLALKKRVYEAADWSGFRDAVNAHKAFGDYITIQK